MQTKKMSLVEATAQAVTGWIVSVATQIILLPYFDVHISIKKNMLIGLVFVIIGMARGYLVRRFFNWYSDFKPNVEAKLREIINKNFNIIKEKIKLNSDISMDLQFDSADIINFLLDIDYEFDVEIMEDEISINTTFGEVILIIKSKLHGQLKERRRLFFNKILRKVFPYYKKRVR